LGESSTSQ
jgi:hypothetical protein